MQWWEKGVEKTHDIEEKFTLLRSFFMYIITNVLYASSRINWSRKIYFQFFYANSRKYSESNGRITPFPHCARTLRTYTLWRRWKFSIFSRFSPYFLKSKFSLHIFLLVACWRIKKRKVKKIWFYRRDLLQFSPSDNNKIVTLHTFSFHLMMEEKVKICKRNSCRE